MAVANGGIRPRAAGRISMGTVVAIGLVGAALYAFANWTTFSIAIPGTDDVSLRPQFAVVIFAGFAFGPVAGFIAGFAGNVLGDMLTGFGALTAWPWSLANGAVGLLSGIFAGVVAVRTSSGGSKAIMAGVAGVTATVLGFLLIWIELITQPDLGQSSGVSTFEYILTKEYLPTIVVNSVVAAVITPLVVRFWEPLHDLFGQS